ncbi:MAG TPA: M20/M25/M40 family metallo-hydrolase [Longimicrobiales bacterium]|nr:M20/M25/M40 family metallo-hydrolase [Longimicrobiales bacterium]
MNEIEQYLGMTSSQAIARVLARSRSYVERETPSGAAADIAVLGGDIRRDLEACGAQVEVIEAPGAGVNLHARMPGADAQLEPVVVLTHMDTVHPKGTLARRPLRVEDGRAYGPGIYDMKTGIALVIEALTWLDERGRTPQRSIEVLVTCDEEVGSHSSRQLIEDSARRAAAVLVPEPCRPDGGVKTFRKGVATYEIEAIGVAAHAGIDGELAVSATAELVRAAVAVLDLADHSRGTTLNIGQISGGTASNVVAEHALAVVDVRIAEPPEGERVHAAIMSLRAHNPKAELKVRRSEERPPLVRTEAVAGLYEIARRHAQELGVELDEGGTGGGSDGSFAAALGAATLDGLGAQGGGAHAADEHIVLDDLPFRFALMARLLESL